MGKQTIAEYVDDSAVLLKLRKLGVDFAQGYGLCLCMSCLAPSRLCELGHITLVVIDF